MRLLAALCLLIVTSSTPLVVHAAADVPPPPLQQALAQALDALEHESLDGAGRDWPQLRQQAERTLADTPTEDGLTTALR